MHKVGAFIKSVGVPVWLLIVLGVAARVWMLQSSLGEVDSDEAVVGLMARGIAYHHDAVTYFWGQPYGGSQEAFAAAVLFKIFGASTLALKSVMVLTAVASSVLVYAIGRRFFTEQGAKLAGALFWAGSFSTIWLSTKERGFYGATMVCGLIIVLAVLHLVERPTVKWAAIGGFAAGFGIWASPQIAYVFVPASLWLVVRNWRVIKLLWVIVPAAVVGVLPALLYNLHTDWSSLQAGELLKTTTYPERLELFFTTGLPTLFGFKVQYVDDWLVANWFGILLYGLLLAASTVAFVFWAKRGFRTRRDSELLVVWMLLYPLIFAASPYSFYVTDPRYMVFLWPAVCLALASVLTSLPRTLPVLAAVPLLFVGVSHAIISWPERATHHDLVASDVKPLETFLRDNGVSKAYTDYWISYQLTFESDEQVIATPLGSVRNAEYQRAVNEAANPAYVFYENGDQGERFAAQLTAHGVGFQRTIVGAYDVFNPSTHVDPGTITGVW